MRRRYKHVGIHPCQLEQHDCWPKLKPRASYYAKLIRKLRNGMLPSYYHPLAKYAFKSIRSLDTEKLRMVYECNPFVAHPMSVFALIRWCSYFIFAYIYIFWLCYDFFFGQYRKIGWICITLKGIQLLYIISQFLIGYQNEPKTTKRAELRLYRIAIHYLQSFFIFDLLELIRPGFGLLQNEFMVVWINMCIIHVFLISKYIEISRKIWILKVLFRVRLRYEQIVWNCIIMPIYMHYMTCFHHGMPVMLGILLMYPDSVKELNADLVNYYTSLFHITLPIIQASRPNSGSNDLRDLIIDTISILASYILNLHMVVHLFIIITNVQNAEVKCGYMWNHIFNYMNNRNISGKLQTKIRALYDYKFQNKFFDEVSIINHLSTHLQYENLLHTCSHLMVNIELLHGLPRTVVGRVVAHLQPSVFLPNDVIIRSKTKFDCIYFISHGTVALFNSFGKEISHLNDGHPLGSIGYYTGINYVTVTAVTITELYRWDAKDVKTSVMLCPELALRMKRCGKRQLEILIKSEETKKVSLLPQLTDFNARTRLFRHRLTSVY